MARTEEERGCLACRARDAGDMSPEQTAIYVLVAIRQTSIGHAETHLCDDHHGLMLVTISVAKLAGVRGMLRPSSGGRSLSDELLEERRGELAGERPTHFEVGASVAIDARNVDAFESILGKPLADEIRRADRKA